MTSLVPLQESIDYAVSPFDNTLASPLNTKSSIVKCLNSPTYRVDLPSKTFGGQTDVNLPTNNLISNVILTLKLSSEARDGPATGKLVNGQLVNQGWVYDAIDYIEFSYGTSSTLRVTGDQARVWALSHCESGEKQKSLIRLAGRAFNSNVGADAPGSEKEPGEYVGSVILPLPHSNPNSGKIIPYDLSILTNKPASVRVRFKYGDQFITKGANDTSVRATAFTEAYMSFAQQYLADGPSDSIQALVARGGGRKYDYPFMYPQSFVSESFVGKSGTERHQVELRNFLPGSVQSMTFWLERLTTGQDADDNALLSTSRNNPGWYSPMSNVEVLYGGQLIWKCDDINQELFGLADSPCTLAWDVQVPPYAVGAATEASALAPRVSQALHIQLSQFNEMFVQGGLIQTGAMLNNSTVTIRFNTPALRDLRLADATAIVTEPTFRLHASYNYQCSMRSADGETSVLFVRPDRLLPSV